MPIVPVSISSPIQCFSLFFGRQKHKDRKLEIMINVGKSRLVKVFFSNIHKISDACANNFSRYIMVAQCMRNVFPLYCIQVTPEKWCFWEIYKAHLA